MKNEFTNKSNEELVNTYLLTERESVFEELVKRTEDLRYKLARNYLNIPGSELDDLVSEGLMETFKAVKNFDSSKGVLFTTFLYSAISRRYNKLFTKATCEKNLGESFTESYDRLSEGGVEDDSEFVGYGKLEFSVECEEFSMVDILDVIQRTELSEKERVSIELLTKGFTKPEIAKVLGVKVPSVHTYINRAGKKLSLCGLAV